jgi:hypothetical protein
MGRPELFHRASFHNAALLTGGWVLVVAGILALPLPGPFTTPAVALGGVVLTRHSAGFRHGVARLRSRFPRGSDAISRRSRGWPRALRYLVLRTDPRRVSPRVP